jgi:hypothetical protein
MQFDRQLPHGDEVFLDHVGYFVENLEKAGAAFARLGFTVSPIHLHYNADARGNLAAAGTGNRLITFRAGYLEVLAALDQTPLADQLRDALRRYAGLHLIAFTHADMASQRRRLVEAGFDPQPAVRLRRTVQTADGPQQVAVTVVRARPGSMPEGRVQLLTHHTPELIWRPGYTVHANHATALTDVLVVAQDPEEAWSRFQRFSGCPGKRSEDLWWVALHRGRVSFASPTGALCWLPALEIPSLPYVAAVALRSSDLTLTRAFFDRPDTAAAFAGDGALGVAPRDGMGAYLFFHAPRGGPPWKKETAS